VQKNKKAYRVINYSVLAITVIVKANTMFKHFFVDSVGQKILHLHSNGPQSPDQAEDQSSGKNDYKFCFNN
jgi:hypothetical protein